MGAAPSPSRRFKRCSRGPLRPPKPIVAPAHALLQVVDDPPGGLKLDSRQLRAGAGGPRAPSDTIEIKAFARWLYRQQRK